MRSADFILNMAAFLFRAPATQVKTDLKSPAQMKRFSTRGIEFSKLENRLESNRAVLAHATHCAQKFAIRFTATNWMKKRHRLKLASDFLFRSKKANSMAAPFLPNKNPTV